MSTSRTPLVAVIGTGFGGIAAAYRLRRTGARVVLFERADRVGGVWRENHYPGSACDVPSFLYSFSFAPKHDWSRKFAPQAEIQQYIEDTVDALGLRPSIRFNEELVAAHWHEDDSVWDLAFASGLRERVDILVAATGQMSTPNLPLVPGAADFQGPAFHSAQWDHAVDVTDREVVVVGTGASVIQIVPAIAGQARHVTVIQRSPGYVLGKGDHPYAGAQSRMGARLRRWQSYLSKELRTPRLIRWPSLTAPAERRFRKDLERWVPDDELRSKVMPDDRYGCKRILVSNEWYATLQRDNVDLLDDRVERMTAAGVTTESGVTVPADVVVYGTGFRTHAFLESVDVRGRGGLSLARAWEAGPEAYLGMAVPNFPNFFLMYGPNTNPAWNSVLVILEWQAQYLARVVREWQRRGPLSMDVTTSASASFSADMQRRSSKSVWVTGCANWFTTATGRNTQNWPRMATAYWWLTRRIVWSDFDTRSLPAAHRAASDGSRRRHRRAPIGTAVNS